MSASRRFSFPIFLLLLLGFCLQPASFAQRQLFTKGDFPNVEAHFTPPAGFTRVDVKPSSFASFLRAMPVREQPVAVLDFSGKHFKEAGDSTVAAVIALDIAGCRMEQCMDILMRLHSHWLLQTGRTDSIAYPLPDGTLLRWSDWQKGTRPVFKGARFQLQKTAKAQQAGFEKYMQTLFEYSGTQTFYYHYERIPLDELQAGDFLVKKGRRGHAVLVLDLARDKQGNRKALFLQGDTPACQPYILKQPDGSPWFNVDSSAGAPGLPISKIMPWRGLRRFPAVK